jgi:hypothetical protein
MSEDEDIVQFPTSSFRSLHMIHFGAGEIVYKSLSLQTKDLLSSKAKETPIPKDRCERLYNYRKFSLSAFVA